MMTEDYVHRLPKSLRWFVGSFVFVLALGYFSAISFVQYTTSSNPAGIEQQYLGNEDDLEAEQMKFKKSPHEMLNIVHTHVLSISVLFFLLGGLVYGVRMNGALKRFIMVEPFFSIVFTFGGLYLMWSGWTWMVYVVMVSGTLMTVCFAVGCLLIIRALLQSPSVD